MWKGITEENFTPVCIRDSQTVDSPAGGRIHGCDPQGLHWYPLHLYRNTSAAELTSVRKRQALLPNFSSLLFYSVLGKSKCFTD